MFVQVCYSRPLLRATHNSRQMLVLDRTAIGPQLLAQLVRRMLGVCSSLQSIQTNAILDLAPLVARFLRPKDPPSIVECAHRRRR